MLRVGLTGELGSGKSTVAAMFASFGALVFSSDEMARAMMQPGHPVYRAIVERFGPPVVLPDGQLDRPALARLAFRPANPRVEELNAIIHPAVLAEQERRIAGVAQLHPHAIVVIESALIFTTSHAGKEPWRKRFDRILVVTAPDELKLDRFVARVSGGRSLPEAERAAIRHDAEARLAAQRIPQSLTMGCLILPNTGDLAALKKAVEAAWEELAASLHP